MACKSPSLGGLNVGGGGGAGESPPPAPLIPLIFFLEKWIYFSVYVYEGLLKTESGESAIATWLPDFFEDEFKNSSVNVSVSGKDLMQL